MRRNMKLGTVTLSALAIGATLLSGEARPKGKPEEQKIEVVASRFSFSPNEITIKKGEPVVITLRSSDVTHGLVIEELGVRTEVKKGETEALNVTAQTPGTFQGRCAHFCGQGHGSMTFTVHVVE